MPAVIIRNPTPRLPPLRQNQGGYAGAKSRITQIGILNGYSYLFPYTPVNIKFDSVGSEYSEINRAGNYSLVTRKQPNLLRVSFDFRVAHRPSNGLQPISKDLNVLRKIAVDDIPIIISGIGGYLSSTGTSSLSAKKFRVTNLSVEIVTASETNEPWQANCSIELIEDRNPPFTVVKFATIKYPPAPPAKTSSTSGGGNKKPNNTPTSPKPDVNYSGIKPPSYDSPIKMPTSGTVVRR
jgi:hypothetical protein